MNNEVVNKDEDDGDRRYIIPIALGLSNGWQKTTQTIGRDKHNRPSTNMDK